MNFSQCLSSWMPLLCSSLSSLPGAPLLWCRFWLPVPPTWNVLYHHSFNKYMHLLQCNAFDTFDMHTIEYVTIQTVYFDRYDIKQIHVLTKVGWIARWPACPGLRGQRVFVWCLCCSPCYGLPLSLFGQVPFVIWSPWSCLSLSHFWYQKGNHQTMKDAVKWLFSVSRGFITQYYAWNPLIKRDNHFTASFAVWWFMF